MANPDHVTVVREGAEAIHEWRRRNASTPLSANEGETVGG